jgi:regulator of replication initiation timing
MLRRLRSNFGIGSSRMAIRSQLAWYWRWLLNVLMMVLVATVVWWLVQNSYRITGFDIEEAKAHLGKLTEDNRVMTSELEAARGTLSERDRQLQIEKAAQGELARTVTQLQDENASLKEDLAFLRNIMSSGTTPEGIGMSNLKVERDGKPNEYRYRMLLTQGGQRKQDFKGKVQIVARVAKDGAMTTLTLPDTPAADQSGAFEFRFYQKVEGRFSIPDGASLKGLDVRVLALPGGQVKLSRTINQL